MNNKNSPTIVVVGAAGGIGKQVALQLQSRAQVVAVVQNAAQVAEVSALAVLCVECDLSNAASVQSTLDAINAQYKTIDGLVFCAAMQPVGPLELVSRAEMEGLFAINIFGPHQFVQGLIPKLRQSRGRIVLFSSMAGKVATPVIGAYASSKFALEGWADALRRELRLSGVSLSLVEPGGVDTPMASAQAGLVQRTLARLDADSERLYGRLVRGYLALTQAGLRHASTPADVALVAVKAVIGPGAPKARYVAGNDAKLLIMLAGLLPVRWLDALLMKMTMGK